MINKINHPSKYIKSKYKVALVGPYASGKTSLITKFTNNHFSEDYHMTLKPSTYLKSIQLEQCLHIKLEIFDTLGSGFSAHNFYSTFQDVDAILLIYNVTCEASFYKLNDLLAEIKPLIQRQTLFGLIGTHCDHPHLRQITYQQGMKFKKRNGISLFYEISSKTNQNVSELFYDLAKYLIIVNSYRQKQQNPQISTTLEDQRMTTRTIAKVTLLQKKLAYKEQECKNLWKDYEESLDKICSLQAKVKDQSSYILHYNGENQQVQQQIKILEQQIANTQELYQLRILETTQKHQLELRKIQQKSQFYQEQNIRLKSQLQKLSHQLSQIQKIIQQHQQQSNILLSRKKQQIQQIQQQKQKIQQQNKSLQNLIQYERKQHQRLKFNWQESQKKLKEQIFQKQNLIAKMQKQINNLIFLKIQSNLLIEEYEKNTITYRQQMVQKQYLEQQLQIQQSKFCKMELIYQENIQHLKGEYQTHIENLRKQKESILESKEKVVSKIIQSKVNQIKNIRSFIDQIDTKKQKQNDQLKKSIETQKDLQAEAEAESKIRQFFNQFIELIKQNSQFLLYNLQVLLTAYQQIQSCCPLLLEDVEKLDLTEVWYDLKQDQGADLNSKAIKAEAQQLWRIINFQAQKRIAKCVSSIQQMTSKLGEANDDLKVNLGHINQSISKVQKLSQMGIQAYVQSLNS